RRRRYGRWWRWSTRRSSRVFGGCRSTGEMHPERLAIVQGWGDTRAALRRWNARPGPVVGPWLLGSLAVAVALLLATWAIALVSTPDLTHVGLAGVGAPATVGDYLFIPYRTGR